MNEKDIQQNLDRFQKRAKSWIRKVSEDPETFSANAEKLIAKLSKLLTQEVKPTAQEFLAQVKPVLNSYTGPNARSKKALEGYVDNIKAGLKDLDDAVRDPQAYARAQRLRFGFERDIDNAVVHLMTIAENLFVNVRAAYSTLWSMLKGKLLR